MQSSNDRPGGLMQEIGSKLWSGLREAVRNSTAIEKSDSAVGTLKEEPPVVAQLMIEIRSDGSRTIARGALHDLRSNESANVRAEGRTPGELIGSLLGSLLSLPGSTFEMLRSRQLQPRGERAAPAPAAEPNATSVNEQRDRSQL